MTDMIDLMLVMMYIGCGVYCVYAYFAQRKEKGLLANKIICFNREPQKCRDPEAFLRLILPRTLILGIGLTLFGGLFTLDYFFGGGSFWLTLVLTLLPLGLFAWYTLAQQKAAKRFW